MNNGFDIFKKEALLLQEHYPDLEFRENGDGTPVIVGVLLLTDDQGTQIDSYNVRIVCPPDYPLQFPLVYETGGRIPINIDWHVYSDGHACISSIPEEIIVCNRGITLSSFIQEQVKPYFFNQKYREMHGFFLKERAHGPEGNIDFFKGAFSTNDLRQIVQWLIFIKNNSEPNRVQNCFCSNGSKFRKCHRNAFRLFKPLPKETLDKFIRFLVSHI